MSLISRPCVLVRRMGDTDDFDDTLPEENYVDTVCEIQQQRREEPAGQGELSVTTWIVFFPIGTEVDNGDALLIGDEEYQLVGAPWQADTGSPAVHHVEATAVRTRGPGGS